MTAAADHEATIVARKEELEVIAKSKKILEETAGGAAEKSYSFLQVSASSKMEVRVSTTRKQWSGWSSSWRKNTTLLLWRNLHLALQPP
jgi:hypothetical protein